HQPYYKNKLTGMYELPWVRVHAMTEYVDSPGILAQYPDTKVTYNLVPSFLEQLTDYHRNETADVHTDFARRDWPTNTDGSVAG
ncbi:MAG TPA: glycoside hydrolase, partial [Candidatus Poseidoniaceae archaeon]|nr:glycoside hydrolase [Candidatus Poseidoniaceae archaeon]